MHGPKPNRREVGSLSSEVRETNETAESIRSCQIPTCVDPFEHFLSFYLFLSFEHFLSFERFLSFEHFLSHSPPVVLPFERFLLHSLLGSLTCNPETLNANPRCSSCYQVSSPPPHT